MDRNMTALTLGAAIPPDIAQTITQTKQSYHYHNDIIDWLLEPNLLISMLQNIPAHRYEYIRNNYIINNEDYSNRKKHRAHNNPTTNNKNKHHVPAWKQKDDEAKAQNPELTNDPYAIPGEVLLSPEERAKNAQAVLDSLE